MRPQGMVYFTTCWFSMALTGLKLFCFHLYKALFKTVLVWIGFFKNLYMLIRLKESKEIERSCTQVCSLFG